jgi:cytochrome c-type biogenesis protein CcmE
VFTLEGAGGSMRIWYRGILPDTFRDQAEAVVLGTVVREDGTWWLAATELMTKCGGKYDGSPQESPSTKFK